MSSRRISSTQLTTKASKKKSRMGVAGDCAATEHHVDEPGKVIMKSASRADITDLQQIPNIGPSIAANLRRIGIHFTA